MAGTGELGRGPDRDPERLWATRSTGNLRCRPADHSAPTSAPALSNRRANSIAVASSSSLSLE